MNSNPTKAHQGLARIFAGVAGALFLITSASAQIASFTLDDFELVGGYTTKGNIQLSNPAPEGGAVVSVSCTPVEKVGFGLTASSQLRASSDTIIVPAGKRNRSFNILTQTVLADTAATVIVSYDGDTKVADLLLRPGGLTDVDCDAELCSGETGQGEAWLSGPQAVDVTIDLLSFQPAVAAVPASTVVPAGQKRGGFFTITAGVVAVASNATIRARLNNSIRLCTTTVNPNLATLTVQVLKNNGAPTNNAGVSLVYEDGTTLSGLTKNGIIVFGPPLPAGNAKVYVRMPGSGITSGPYPISLNGCGDNLMVLSISNK